MKIQDITYKNYVIGFKHKNNKKYYILSTFESDSDNIVNKIFFRLTDNVFRGCSTLKYEHIDGLNKILKQIKNKAPIDISIKIEGSLIAPLDEKGMILDNLKICEYKTAAAINELSIKEVEVLTNTMATRQHVITKLKSCSIDDCNELMKSFPKLFGNKIKVETQTV